jgi:hypothetical protein
MEPKWTMPLNSPEAAVRSLAISSEVNLLISALGSEPTGNLDIGKLINSALFPQWKRVLHSRKAWNAVFVRECLDFIQSAKR